MLEYLECFAGLYELHGVRGRTGRALGAAILEYRARELCDSLPKGLRQQVSLARALLDDPVVPYFDESTANPDPSRRARSTS